MINFRRQPSALATKRQARRIDALITNDVLQDASEVAEAFLFTALDFGKAFREGRANQGMVADVWTLYQDWKRTR